MKYKRTQAFDQKISTIILIIIIITIFELWPVWYGFIIDFHNDYCFQDIAEIVKKKEDPATTLCFLCLKLHIDE